MKKRILFLMSDTGGGHRAAAEAVDEAVHHLYPDIYETIIEDIWKEHTPWPVNKLPGAYPWMTGPGMPLWKLMWKSSHAVKTHKVMLPTVSPVVKRKLSRYYREIQPDLIVSVHPLMNHIARRVRNKSDMKHVPFATVVTDMVSIHPTWIDPKVDLCTVPTEPARQLAIDYGISAKKVFVTGQPVSLKFSADEGESKTALRHRLGLQAERPTILVVGGGEGFGRVYEIARAIAVTNPQAQLMVVSGRNQALKEGLDSVAWEIPTQIFGFVKNMPDLMRASDILVTKAGPGTISEAFICDLPMIIFGYIPGQETGNITYIQEHKAGGFSEEPQEIADLVFDWTTSQSDFLRQMTQNAAALAKPDAALAIAAKVCDLI